MCNNRFYEDDADGIFRCSDCNKIVDPDDIESAMEEANDTE